MIDSPSGSVPEKASRWDLEGTDTCGGGKSVSGGSLLVWEYLRIYSAEIRSRGATSGPQAWEARLPSLSLPRASSGLLPKLPVFLLVQKKLIQSFFLRLDFVWYYFPKKPKTCRKQQLALGTELIG
jgi:hypothetical protein